MKITALAVFLGSFFFTSYSYASIDCTKKNDWVNVCRGSKKCKKIRQSQYRRLFFDLERSTKIPVEVCLFNLMARDKAILWCLAGKYAWWKIQYNVSKLDIHQRELQSACETLHWTFLLILQLRIHGLVYDKKIIPYINS